MHQGLQMLSTQVPSDSSWSSNSVQSNAFGDLSDVSSNSSQSSASDLRFDPSTSPSSVRSIGSMSQSQSVSSASSTCTFNDDQIQKLRELVSTLNGDRNGVQLTTLMECI